jgi:lysophospholipase L1-like esterase
LFLLLKESNDFWKSEKKKDLTLTSRILEELKKEVETRGAKLLVVFIPSKREIERFDDSLPYQTEIARLCLQLGIEYFDLAPNFKATWRRTYYRLGGHWNARGHRIAAEALHQYLTTDRGL